MNESEARELNLGTIFHHDPSKKLYTGFEHLKKLLDDNHLTHWVSRYHESPKAWQPFDSDQSIEQLVTQTLSNLNKAGGYAQPLNPSFKDIRTLNDESNRDLLWELRDEGCVVIIDSISMHHPVLQQSFHNSFLDVSPKTAVVTIAPIYNIFDLMRKMTITFQLSI